MRQSCRERRDTRDRKNVAEFSRYPFVRSNSRMNCTSASMPASGNAL
jgi:hypothetical protein